MPNAQQHLELARHHEGFVNSLDTERNPFSGWALVGAYTAVLQYIEAYLASEDVHYRAGTSRDRVFHHYPDLRPLYAHYRTLKDEAEAVCFDDPKIPPATIRRILENSFYPIRDTFRRLVSTD